MSEKWQYFKWFCPNCGELVFGYINSNGKIKVRYLMIFSVLKRLFENGSIDRKVFDRLNTKNAEQQGCKAIIF